MATNEEEAFVNSGSEEQGSTTGINAKPADVKVILLGESSVGKTCLVKRLLTRCFMDNTDVTYGAAYAPYTLKLGNEDIKLSIWDTAGAERFRTFISTYFRDAKAAVICYSLDDVKTFKRVEYWVESVRHHEASCDMYICGTKKDLVTSAHKAEITSEMVTNIVTELEAVWSCETSSKTGENVDILFKTIGENCYKNGKMSNSNSNSGSRNISLPSMPPEGNTRSETGSEADKRHGCSC